MASRVSVEPNVLKWARTSAGFDEEGAARKLGVSQASLEKWERGELDPTVRQLRAAAKAYRRPLAVLLLPEPPADFDALRDFRHLSGQGGKAWSPALHSEFKRALSQREVFLELNELAPGAVADSAERFSLPADADVETAADIIRSALALEEVPVDPDGREVLNAYVAAVEAAGIIVIQTAGIDISEMRGFSISEWPYPVVALNGGDWPRARVFSLLHEVAHLAANSGGLCDLHEATKRTRTEEEVEHRCNAIAAAVLMPKAELLADPVVKHAGKDHPWTLEELLDLARRFGASSEAILLRLISLGASTWALYRERKPELDREYAEARDRQRQRQKETSGGPSFYVVKARDLGHGYVASVLSAFEARAISSLDVADYLDVRFDQIPKLEAAVRR